MIKKISIIITIVAILLTNLISNISYGYDLDDYGYNVDSSGNIEKDTGGIGLEESDTDFKTFFNGLNNGQVSITNSKGQQTTLSTTLSKSTNGFVGATIITILNSIPILINHILVNTIISIEGPDAVANMDQEYYFTIYDVVMGHYSIFNFNFGNFDKSFNGTEDFLQSEIDSALNKNKENVGKQIKILTNKYYYILRNLTIGISLFVLIYIGIRMAISTVTATKVKYKKMLTNWVVSIILVFFMHLIIIVLSYVSTKALSLIDEIAKNIGINNIEPGIMSGLLKDLSGKSGWNAVTTGLTILYFAILQLKFFVMYTKRFCEITILTVISPLVTITYSIDKVKDNKAQAFNAWVRELIMKVAIQIVHAIAYCLFILSAAAIAQKAPLIALLFFSGLSRAEKVINNILDVKHEGIGKIKLPFID